MEKLINKLSKIFWIILIIFCSLQVITYQTIDVVVGCFVSLVTYFIFSKFIFTVKSLKQRPISLIAISAVIMFTYFAPIMTYIEKHPITYNMISPISTFFWQLLYVIVTFIAYIYTGRKYKSRPLQKILIRVGYFDTVSNKSLWILGFLGLIGRIYLLKNQFGEEATGGAGSITMLLIPFLMAPYCILFRPLLSKREKPYVGSKVPFIVYTLLLLIMAVASNTRNAIVTVLISLLLMAIFYNINYREDIINKLLNISAKKIIFLFVTVLIVLGPISNFAVAMVTVRYMRSDIGAKELFIETCNLAMDSEKMSEIKKSLNTVDGHVDLTKQMLANVWNEDYISNVFMNRVCNYQVADASIYHANRAGIPCKSFIDDSFERVKIIFPSPIVKLFFGDIDKNKFAYSPMDFLYSQSMHSPIFKGYIVGGDVGLGLGFFGYLFPLFQFLIYIFIFRYLDQIVMFNGHHAVIPTLTLISIYDYFFTFFVSTGVFERLVSFFWVIPVGLILKILMMKIVKKVFG